MAAYRDEPNVDRQSNTPTFAAKKLTIDAWRWLGVPIYLRTEKRLAKRKMEIAICFQIAPFSLSNDFPVDKINANWLFMGLQPNEGISMSFCVEIQVL